MTLPRTSEAPTRRLWPAWAVQGGGVAMMLAGLALPWVMGWVGCVGFEERLVEVEVETGSSGDATTDGTTGGTTAEETTLVATTTGGTTGGDTGGGTTGEAPPEKKWKAGERFAAKTSLRPALVFIPGGAFHMGSPATEKDRDDDELRHTARVDAFVMCNTEVTQGQYKAVMGKNPSSCGDKGAGCGSNFPVQNVNWNDACAYMQKLTELENKARETQGLPALTACYEKRGGTWAWTDHACTGFRLPTEAEWERAARAGKGTAYFFGDAAKNDQGEDILGKYAVYDRELNARPDPVAKKSRSPWGLYDIYGNVWEWCWDWYSSYKLSSDNDHSGPEKGEVRVLRGGSFNDWLGDLRSADRDWYVPTDQRRYDGFRCVRAPHPS